MAKLFQLLSSGLVVAENHRCILEEEVILRVGEVSCSSMEEEETSRVEVESDSSREGVVMVMGVVVICSSMVEEETVMVVVGLQRLWQSQSRRCLHIEHRECCYS